MFFTGIMISSLIANCLAKKNQDTKHDNLLSYVATKISASDFPSPKYIRLLRTLLRSKDIPCHGVHFNQTVRFGKCQPKLVRNKLCFGSCFSEAIPSTLLPSSKMSVAANACQPDLKLNHSIYLLCPLKSLTGTAFKPVNIFRSTRLATIQVNVTIVRSCKCTRL